MDSKHRGVFWIVDDKLLAFPYSRAATIGLSKSGENYNHKELWEIVRPSKCHKSFDYYPRGRLEINNKGKPILYMNPNIDEKSVPEIMEAFGVEEYPRIHYDGSEHYKCHFDRSIDF